MLPEREKTTIRLNTGGIVGEITDSEPRKGEMAKNRAWPEGSSGWFVPGYSAGRKTAGPVL